MTHDDQAGSAVPDLDALEAVWAPRRWKPVPNRSAVADLLALVAHARALRAEVERLSLLAWVTTSQRLAGVEVPPDVAARLLAEEERDEARADNARLRAALEQIAGADGREIADGDLQHIARAALAGQEEQG